MNVKLQDADLLLANARAQGNLDELAEALTVHANALLEAGQIEPARLDLDEATKIHQQQGHLYDEARCTHFAATVYRLNGQLDEAKKRAERALQLAEQVFEGPNPIAVSAFTELGEIALVEQKGADAARAYGRAIDVGQTAGLLETAQAALLRKRAIALVACQRYHEAATDLQKAHDFYLNAGDKSNALRALVEKATALQQGGYIAEAKRVIFNTIKIAKTVNDHHIQADLYLLQATQAVEKRDIDTAMSAAQKARHQALMASAPISYISASVAIADLAEANGDHLAAYEALAVGWVTLSDLMGRDMAKATFKPKLLKLRAKWGTEMFNHIKSEYEAR